MLNKTFIISKKKAIKIGDKYGIKDDDMYATLKNNRMEVLDKNYKGEKVISYYWEVSIRNCEKCEMIHIDPKTGEIISELLIQSIKRN